VPVGRALRNIRDEKKVWRGNERLRARRGTQGSIVDEADWLALEQREQELVAGHGEFTYGAYLTVTADNERELEQAVAGARNALSVPLICCREAVRRVPTSAREPTGTAPTIDSRASGK